MTIHDFLKNPSDFKCFQEPLDISLEKMRCSLYKQINKEYSMNGELSAPIVERISLQSPEYEFGEIAVKVSKGSSAGNQLLFDVDFTITSKQGNLSNTVNLYSGCWDDVDLFLSCFPLDYIEDPQLQFEEPMVETWDFLKLCKANALWFDYQVTHDILRQRVHVTEDDLAREDGQSIYILVCLGRGYPENGWPAPQLKEALPEAQVIAPQLAYLDQNPTKFVERILTDNPQINMVVTGIESRYFESSLSAFNSDEIRPDKPLSILGTYACHEAKGFNVYWRRKMVPSIKDRIMNNCSAILRKILNERIELYRQNEGQYEIIVNQVMSLFDALSSQLSLSEAEGIGSTISVSQPVHVKDKKIKLTITISPSLQQNVSVSVVAQNELVKTELCRIHYEPVNKLKYLFDTCDNEYEIFRNVKNMIDKWPTPLEIKFKYAKKVEGKEFIVQSQEEPQIIKLDRNCTLHIMGQTFHGIDNIKSQKQQGVVILERFKLFPCFDSYDYASENRFYYHFLFCKDNADADDKRKDFEAIPQGYGCLINKDYPEYLRPMVYYADESEEMILLY